MANMFIWVLENSVEISIVILLVLILRLFMRRLPKLVCYVMWGAVFLRLICPVELVTPVGLLPQVHISSQGGINLSWTSFRQGADSVAEEDAGIGAEREGAAEEDAGIEAKRESAIEEDAGTGDGRKGVTGEDTKLEARRKDVTEKGSDSGAEEGKDAKQTTDADVILTENQGMDTDIDIDAGAIKDLQKTISVTGKTWFQIVMAFWFVGMLGMVLCGISQAAYLERRLAVNRKLCYGYRHGAVYETDYISVPFVFGFFRPSIYLPGDLDRESRRYILLHEQIHICRYDYLIKYLAYVILCIYWFHPLVWLAYCMLERDMEYACDESVIGQIPGEQAAYSKALLAVAAQKQGYRRQQIPLAFSEKNTKARIKNILSFKKRSGRVAAAVLGVSVIVGIVCIMTTGGFHQNGNTGENSSRTAGETEDTQRGGKDTEKNTEKEPFGANAPCFIADEDGNIVSTRNFGRRADTDTIVLKWTAFPPLKDLDEVASDSYSPVRESGKEQYSILSGALEDCSVLRELIIPYAGNIDYVAEDAFDNSNRDNLTVYCDKGTYLWGRLKELGIRRKEITEEQKYKARGTVPTMVMSRQGEVLGLSEDSGHSDQILENGLTFPPETKVIGTGICNNYPLVVPLTIPKNVRVIKEGAFSCSSITSVTFQGNKLRRIEANAFSANEIKKIKIPEGVKEIERDAFNCWTVKEMVLPSSLKTIGQGNVYGDKIVVRSRDVNYEGKFLTGWGKDVTVCCYKGSTTENYILSNFSGVRLEYLKEDSSDQKKEQQFSSTSSSNQDELESNRKKANSAVHSKFAGKFGDFRAGEITRKGRPGSSVNWNVSYYADVTGDGVADWILLRRLARKQHLKNSYEYYVTVDFGQEGDDVWKWKWSADTAAYDNGEGKSLGLYYKDGKTYLLEMVSKKNSLYYEIFQLDRKGKRVTYQKELYNYKKLSKKVDKGEYSWEEYDKSNQKWQERLKISDLILEAFKADSGICESVRCSIPEQRWSMYGNIRE